MAQVTDGHASSELGPRERAALLWTDAYLTDAEHMSNEDRAEVLRVLTPAELAELTYVVMRFQSGSKLRMVLRLLPEIASGTVV